MQIKRIIYELFNNLEVFPSGTGISHSNAGGGEDPLHLLYAYIEAELDGGGDAAERFPQVHQAIFASDEAQQQYVDLKEILVAERDGTLVIPSDMPAFDFSYLGIAPSVLLESSWQWAQPNRLVIEFSKALVDSLQPPLVETNRFKSSGSEKALLTYQVNQPSKADLVVSIVAKQSTGADSTVDLLMTVDVPSLQGAPQMADSRIELSSPGQEPLTQTTDPFGQTIFRRIPIGTLPKLRFAIEPASLASK